MRAFRHSYLFLAPLVLGLCALAGCGGSAKPVTVTGTVKVPANIKLVDTDSINVVFLPAEAGAANASANCNAKDGSFTASVPPGKYKITISIVPYAGMPDSQKRHREMENFLQKFDEHTTPLNVEIGTESTQTITIDMEKKTVTK